MKTARASATTFQASQSLLDLADSVTAARAQVERLRPLTEAIERQILASGEFVYDAESPATRAREFTGPIGDPKHTHLMRKDQWDAYYTRYRAMHVAQGLQPPESEGDALPMSQTALVRAESAFIDQLGVETGTGLTSARLYGDKRTQALDAGMRLVGVFQRQAAIKERTPEPGDDEANDARPGP